MRPQLLLIDKSFVLAEASLSRASNLVSAPVSPGSSPGSPFPVSLASIMAVVPVSARQILTTSNPADASTWRHCCSVRSMPVYCIMAISPRAARFGQPWLGSTFSWMRSVEDAPVMASAMRARMRRQSGSDQLCKTRRRWYQRAAGKDRS